jgi:hypothetical protein
VAALEDGTALLRPLSDVYWMDYVDASGTSHTRRAGLPTPAELHEEFRDWRATRMEGYVVFAWHWPSGSPSMWLANHPEFQDQLAIENGS